MSNPIKTSANARITEDNPINVTFPSLRTSMLKPDNWAIKFHSISLNFQKYSKALLKNKYNEDKNIIIPAKDKEIVKRQEETEHAIFS
jgi:hypothetical protein